MPICRRNAPNASASGWRRTRILGSDGKPTLVFTFTTSSAVNGIIGQVVKQDYDFYWLHKVAGIGQPKPTSNGFGFNLVTAQPGSLGLSPGACQPDGDRSG